MFSVAPGRLLPGPYRSLFADRTFRRVMPVFALSDLGDGMTVVAVAWFALALGPDGGQGALAGIAVAAYVLPGALGALVLGRWMRQLPARRLLVTDSTLRAVLLGAVPLAHVAGLLTPAVYVGLLGASSLLHAWGKAGKHALFAPLLPEDQRLAANSVISTSLWTATIAGPALAGLLVGVISPAWIIGLNAATFAMLALQTGRTNLPRTPVPPVTGGTQHGLSILRRQPELFGLLLVTWVFNLAFGPVEVALPLFVSDDLDAGAGLLGVYWSAFGSGAVIGALALGAAKRLPLWLSHARHHRGPRHRDAPFRPHGHRPSLPDRLRFRRTRLRPLLRTLFHPDPGPRTRRLPHHGSGRAQRRTPDSLSPRSRPWRLPPRPDQRSRCPRRLRCADDPHRPHQHRCTEALRKPPPTASARA
ncbi:MFS transporter [Streptomyces sp. UP1A-1]|nr:MFS transporter [Streptomyces sp. UP1A-1]